MWKKLGKEGFAVQAPWPESGEVDKLLMRQAKFLRDSLKHFRSTAGKAKKDWKQASIVVSDTYPEWKIDALRWLQSQYESGGGRFPDTLMKDLKGWTNDNIKDKKMIKLVMQFVSFTQKEVSEVGTVAMDIELPFDQESTLIGSMQYIKSQLGLPDVDILKTSTTGEETVPERVTELATPGKPYLWMR